MNDFGVLVNDLLEVFLMIICNIGALEYLAGPDSQRANLHKGTITFGHVIYRNGHFVNIFGLTLPEDHVPVVLELAPVSGQSSQGAANSGAAIERTRVVPLFVPEAHLIHV